MLSSAFLLHARGTDSIQPSQWILHQAMTPAWNASRPGSTVGKCHAKRLDMTSEVWIFAVRDVGSPQLARQAPCLTVPWSHQAQ